MVSAESELGTLPVSAFCLRALHTRSGLGRSGGTTPHPQQRCAPTVPAHCTHRRGEYSLVTSRASVPSGSTATALRPHRPPRCPSHAFPDMSRTRSRADRSDPPRPHARKRRWQEGGTHRNARLMSAESELGTLPFSELLWRSLHTRSGLGRLAVLRRTHCSHVPLRYPRTVPQDGGAP